MSPILDLRYRIAVLKNQMLILGNRDVSDTTAIIAELESALTHERKELASTEAYARQRALKEMDVTP